jgi:hypothetical protein
LLYRLRQDFKFNTFGFPCQELFSKFLFQVRRRLSLSLEAGLIGYQVLFCLSRTFFEVFQPLSFLPGATFVSHRSFRIPYCLSLVKNFFQKFFGFSLFSTPAQFVSASSRIYRIPYVILFVKNFFQPLGEFFILNFVRATYVERTFDRLTDFLSVVNPFLAFSSPKMVISNLPLYLASIYSFTTKYSLSYSPLSQLCSN